MGGRALRQGGGEALRSAGRRVVHAVHGAGWPSKQGSSQQLSGTASNDKPTWSQTTCMHNGNTCPTARPPTCACCSGHLWSAPGGSGRARAREARDERRCKCVPRRSIWAHRATWRVPTAAWIARRLSLLGATRGRCSTPSASLPANAYFAPTALQSWAGRWKWRRCLTHTTCQWSIPRWCARQHACPGGQDRPAMPFPHACP